MFVTHTRPDEIGISARCVPQVLFKPAWSILDVSTMFFSKSCLGSAADSQLMPPPYEDPMPHAWSMCAACLCPCISLSRATPLGQSLTTLYLRPGILTPLLPEQLLRARNLLSRVSGLVTCFPPRSKVQWGYVTNCEVKWDSSNFFQHTASQNIPPKSTAHGR